MRVCRRSPSAATTLVSPISTTSSRSTVSDGVTFVEGPDAWCNDEALSTDLAMRWDGVHVYKPGAELIYETIAPALVALPGRTD